MELPDKPKAEITPIKRQVPGVFAPDSFMGQWFQQVVYPKLMDLGYSAGNAILEQLFYGRMGASKNGKRPSYYSTLTGHTDYSSYYSTNGKPTIASTLYGTADPFRKKTNYTSWPCEDIQECDIRLDEMATYIEAGGKLSISDMFDIFEIGNPPSTANNFGWTSIKDAQRVPNYDKPGTWLIMMPKPVDIKNI